MANPNDEMQFGLGDVSAPLRRAHTVEQRHEAKGILEKAWNFTKGVAPYVSVIDNPALLAYRLGTDVRIQRVFMASGRSLDAASRMMGSESLQIGQGLLAGIVPMLGELARDAGIGAVAGGLIGAVGGLGLLDEATIPSGAIAGAELALWIGGFLGLKDILMEGAKHLGRFSSYAIDATELAWYAGEDRDVSTEHDINDASKLFAVAISELWWVILQSLIFWVMRRAAELAGSAVGAAAKSEAFQTALNEAKGKTAKFGVQFGDWFEKNFNRIEKTVNERERELKQVEAGDSGQSQPEQKPPPKKAPTYQWGQGDGGPGKWGPPTTPRNSLGVAYQEQVTGAPAGTEYKVPLASRKSGFVDFDGYDPDRNVLIDAKDYNNWPPDDPPFLRDKAIDKILSEADDQVEAANGTPIEWHVPTDAKAVELTNIFKDNGVEGITVVTTPK